MLLVYILAWMVLTARLFYWQIISSSEFSARAGNLYQKMEELTPPRGKIFSSDGFPLVMNKESFLLFIRPNLIEDDGEEIYQKIGNFFSLEKEDYQKVVKNKNIFWYPLAKNLNRETKEEIGKRNIKEIGFDSQWQREYPEASMAAHLLGFVGADDLGKKTGYFGLEGYYDRELYGKFGELSWERDLLGRKIIIGEGEERKASPGRDLYLFLDRSLQFMAEKHLQEGIEKYKAVAGSVIILNPQNGGVLAMASFPAYDPAIFMKEDKTKFSNPAVAFSFEPGSIFKPLIMAAAIDLNLVNSGSICSLCGGPMQIGEYTIKTWNEKYYPDSTMAEIIQHSDNVGMAFVSRKVGVKNILNYLKQFGFGQKTEIDLQEESSPGLRREEDWSEIDLATVGFGQGIAVTPIQMIKAIAAIANEGKLVAPKVAQKIIDKGSQIEIKVREGKQVIKPITAKIITEMMVQAVEKGESKWVKPKGYRIAGKTGTAQIPIAGHYDKEKTVASFVGFAPAENPRFVMLVILREPQTSPWGSETAAPLWFQIARDIFRIWGIPPG